MNFNNPYMMNNNNFNNNMPQANQPIFNYIFVNSYDDVKAYRMMPNQKMMFFLNGEPMFFQKTANEYGQTIIQAFKFQETALPQPPSYAKESDIKALQMQIEQLTKMLNNNAQNGSNKQNKPNQGGAINNESIIK